MAPKPSRPGTLIANLLAGAWRSAPARLDFPAPALDTVAPLLHKSGGASLAWWRLRDTPLADTPAGHGFHQAYRLNTLEAEVHALKAAAVLDCLEGSGVDVLVVKGWAIARQYPEVGLRPYTDLDLIVRPGQLQAARAALLAAPSLAYPVDLHDGPSRLDAMSFDELRGRAEKAGLGDRDVWVPGPEDHLRILALHALRHGLFRPGWLVDLAVIVETRTRTFDWARCLGADRRRADWVACAVALAHRLLLADVEGTPAAARLPSLPRWLPRAVLRSWNRCEGTSHREPVFDAFARQLGSPANLWDEAWFRWNRPIQATVEVGGPFNRLPRWPFQVAAVARRTREIGRTLRQLATGWRGI